MLALKWWKQALLHEHVERFNFKTTLEVVDLFCDARGTPPRAAAVYVAKGRICYTDWEPTSAVLKRLQFRKDEQIMAQELLAVVLGLHTFLPLLQGRLVRIWEDNKGVEGALRKGSAIANDHNLIVHSVWLLAARMGMALWIERVPSHDNIADDPSRENYDLLKALGAVYWEPVVPREVWEPDAWESVAL